MRRNPKKPIYSITNYIDDSRKIDTYRKQARKTKNPFLMFVSGCAIGLAKQRMERFEKGFCDTVDVRVILNEFRIPYTHANGDVYIIN